MALSLVNNGLWSIVTPYRARENTLIRKKQPIKKAETKVYKNE